MSAESIRRVEPTGGTELTRLRAEVQEWREDAELKQSALVRRYATALRQIAAMKYEADPHAPHIAREALDGP